MEEKELQKKEWFNSLTDDVTSALREGIFNHSWLLIETYHLVGRRIAQDLDKFKAANVNPASLVSQTVGKSKRTIERAMQFYKKFPDLNDLPEGKNTNWHRICNVYLIDNKKEETAENENLIKCPACGHKFEGE